MKERKRNKAVQGISDFEEIMFELFVFNCIIYSNRFLLNLIIEKKYIKISQFVQEIIRFNHFLISIHVIVTRSGKHLTSETFYLPLTQQFY